MKDEQVHKFDLVNMWQLHRPAIEKALEAMGGMFQQDDVLKLILNGKMHFWVEKNAFAITEVEQYPRKRFLNIFHAGGDLEAVIAAILFDGEARDAASIQNPQFGKLREPVLRFTHWARAFEINSADASNELALRNTSSLELLGQHPYRAPHVFNFYRPGYIAPGTETGAAKLTAPELQISNASSVVGYPNFMSMYAFELSPKRNPGQPAAYVADYTEQAALAADPDALLDNLDALLTHGTLETETKDRISQVLNALDAATEEDLQTRTRVAIVMVMTSPEYIVLR